MAHCLAHGRRQIVEVAQNFPVECRHVLEQLGEVYRNDAAARDAGLAAEERLRFHQQHSQPIMDALHGWLEAQFAERKVEPNSSLGKAITYLLRHWKGLTLFLRQAGRPTGQQPLRKGIEAGGSASQERLVLSDAERGAGGRPVHEPDSHLRAVRRQLIRLSDANCSGTPGNWQPIRPSGCRGTTARHWRGRSMMNPAWPKRIDCGHGWVTS